ncbi:MAG: indolepyruvate ferredoxin oxidoreductase subunit alpha, partial [Deltaproteobacteria bacterium]|nr:indolepyruvate ferredoxin oxidoreductase subunit alpha [Deltaproteobacteria bacterium]
MTVKRTTGQKSTAKPETGAYVPKSRALTVPPPGNPGKLLSGNEAIAQAAWEAGVHVACGYPGTPSTEILEALSRYPEISCEWSTNEKVALEIALGASFAGARALVSMKHVGLNVAADPFFSAAYTGVNGGLVVVSADDPGMHSSQNEQDNRLIAAAARVPVLEPSSSQEARDFVIAAFEISERYDIPVMLRTTTRISHGKAPVKVGQRNSIELKPYRKLPAKNILLPHVSRARHSGIEAAQIPGLRRESAQYIQIFEGTSHLTFVTSGPSYHYVREAFPDASVMKLGMVYPLPHSEIRAFVKGRQRVIVVEELEPFLEQRIAAMGIPVEGKNLLPRCGELSVDILRSALEPSRASHVSPSSSLPIALPPRPPVMCAGCSHRGTFYALKQLNAIVSGDVGCYTLGALAPLEAVDCSINMGASISMAHGMEKVLDEPERKRLVAVIGDSTFFHSGISGLIDVLYNGANTTTIILDNHTSAMTGHQAHPGSGETIGGEVAKRIDIPMLCKSLGIESVRISNPYDLLGTLRIIDEEQRREASSVIVADAPCALKARLKFDVPATINPNHCTHCFACTQLGCPAIEFENNHLQINPLLCIACGHCGQVCADCNAGLDVPLILELMHQK